MYNTCKIVHAIHSVFHYDINVNILFGIKGKLVYQPEFLIES